MTGASFILAINLVIAALFALAFLVVAATNRSDRVARWFSLAYVFGVLYILSEFALPVVGSRQLTYTLGFAAFQGALSAVTIGVAVRYRQPIPWWLILISGLVSIAANWQGFAMGRESIVRMLAFQAPYAFLQLLATTLIVRSRSRQPVDIALAVMFALSALQFLSKPLVASLTDGATSSLSYLATTYALYSQSLGAVLQVANGLLMLMLLVRDMLVEITARSETDPLSGLYNRRGFEDRATALLVASSATGARASLVVSDLDSFKSINDSFGHDSGDQVIVAFATLLKENRLSGAIVGRMGGEEFAVLLPDTPLNSARLYAEGLRAAFASLPITVLPAHMRCTASFGVAEFDGAESLSDLRRRADVALYASKRGGRDRVSVAADLGQDTMPGHPLEGTTGLRHV